MANEAQVQQMLDLMKEQMETIKTLQEDNTRLRTAAPLDNPPAAAPVTTEGDAPRYKTKRPDRPVINTGINDREWALAKDSWVRYKQMCNFSETDVDAIRLELRASCSEDLNKQLFEYVGSAVLDTCTEEQLLNHIKLVAVKTVHKEVHRQVFNSMVQDNGESATKFAGRLKAQAFLCQYEIPCKCCDPAVMQNYAEEEVAQRLVAGLRNQEHQRKLLSEAATLTTLEEKINRLHILEMTEESASTLHVPPATHSEGAAARSQYKSSKSKPNSQTGDNQATTTTTNTCKWCGYSEHPGGKSLDRVNCTARNKKCLNCGIKGHLSTVCNKKSNSNAVIVDSTQDGVEVEPIPSGASVSFSFSAQQDQDFRRARKYGNEP